VTLSRADHRRKRQALSITGEVDFRREAAATIPKSRTRIVGIYVRVVSADSVPFLSSVGPPSRESMGPHGGPINIELRPVDLALSVQVLSEFAEDVFQRAVVGPGAKSIVDGLPVAIAAGKVAPERPRPQDPKDAVDHRSVIFIGASSARNLGKIRLNPLKLLVAEFESTLTHRKSQRSCR